MKSLPPPGSCAAVSAFSIRHLAGNTCSAVPGGIFSLRMHMAFAVTLTRNIRKLILSKKYMPCPKGGWRYGCFLPSFLSPQSGYAELQGPERVRVAVMCSFPPWSQVLLYFYYSR